MEGQSASAKAYRDPKRINPPATEGVKVCFRCHVTKPVTAFYAHRLMADGRVGKCKSCNKLDVSENRKAKRDYYNERDRERHKKPEAKKRKRDRAKDAIGREWARSQVHGTKAGRAIMAQRKPCEVCGESVSHAHHDDYHRPLVVRWLCRSHHSQWHTENGPGKNWDRKPF